jgi:hypothetical protein
MAVWPSDQDKRRSAGFADAQQLSRTAFVSRMSEEETPRLLRKN